MSEFVTVTCDTCGTEFRAYPDANAAEKGYCSPLCESEGEGPF